MPGILATVVKAAENGDIQAAKILIDKLCPNLRPVALPIDLPLPINGGLSEMGGEILKATMTGGISPDIGSMLITALANQGRLVDLEEMAAQLKRIERQLENRQ
jgi:dihydrodipicolinate synthase/N-acetylneuraminate lyase